MEKTHAQASGKRPFDWNKFLNKKKFTFRDWSRAIDRAESWATCACGNQCDIIPRSNCGGPIDKNLYALGMQFMNSIKGGNIKASKRVLMAIEQRSAELIRKIKSKKKK